MSETVVQESPDAPRHQNPQKKLTAKKARKAARMKIREYILAQATELRGVKGNISEIQSGGFNVAYTIKFEDDVEWIAKVPQKEKSDGRMNSEIATMKFLQKYLEVIKVPRLHGYSLDGNNPCGYPYILMDKVPGITLCQALIRDNFPTDQCVHEVLDALVSMRKVLRKEPFKEIGSLFLDDEEIGPEVGRLTSPWITESDFQSNIYYEADWYYFEQHRLSHSHGVDWVAQTNADRWLLHTYIAAILPFYANSETSHFYLTHTDLSLSNIMVDPETGRLTGIIDWEFAATLPLQAAEHFPKFLRDEEEFVQFYQDDDVDKDDDTESRLRGKFREWKTYYIQQFRDDPEISTLHDRIDAIIAFERLLREPEKRTFELLAATVKSLEKANALNGQLPPFPWGTRPQLTPLNAIESTQSPAQGSLTAETSSASVKDQNDNSKSVSSLNNRGFVEAASQTDTML